MWLLSLLLGIQNKALFQVEKATGTENRLLDFHSVIYRDEGAGVPFFI